MVINDKKVSLRYRRIEAPNHGSWQNRRSLDAMKLVSSASCENVRHDTYLAKLELFYYYTVETTGEGLSTMQEIENAVSHHLARVLNECDEQHRPLYAVELSSRHVVSSQGFCAPTMEGHTCQLVNGYTAIHFDDQTRTLKNAAYAAIADSLDDLQLSETSTGTIDKAQFIQPIGESLLTFSLDQGKTSNFRAIVAALIVVFVLASIFLVGIVRKRRKGRGLSVSIKKHHTRLGASPRRYFSLDEDHFNEHPKIRNYTTIENFEPLHSPSITWSISDMTSESGSIRSGISRCNSKLESIKEEDEESTSEDHENSIDDNEAIAGVIILSDLPEELQSSLQHNEGGHFYYQKNHDDVEGMETILTNSIEGDSNTATSNSAEIKSDASSSCYQSANSFDSLNVSDSSVSANENLDHIATEVKSVPTPHKQTTNTIYVNESYDSLESWLAAVLVELERSNSRRLITY